MSVEAVVVERLADRADAAVHHVARARRCPRRRAACADRGAREQLERRVVVDRRRRRRRARRSGRGSVYSQRQRSAITSRSGMRLADRARRVLHDALVVPGAAALLVLLGRDAEQQHGGDPERGDLARPHPRPARAGAARRPASPRSARGASMPSSTKSGITRSAAVTRVSRTRSRRTRGPAQPPHPRHGKGHRLRWYGADQVRRRRRPSRAATAYTTVRAARCRSGPASSRRSRRALERLERRLEREAGRDDADHVVEPGATAFSGTSARNASGSDEQRRRAATRLARRARARRARCRAPRTPAPPSSSASSPARRATPVERHERTRPTPSSANATDGAEAAGEQQLSTEQRLRRTSPRTSRAKVCSSRSSASRPAASSSVTNISETIAAIADGERRRAACRGRRRSSASRPSAAAQTARAPVAETPRLSIARPANCGDRAAARLRCGDPAAAARRRVDDPLAACCSPRTSTSSAEHVKRAAACSSIVEVAARRPGRASCESARFASAMRALDDRLRRSAP